VLIPYSVVGLNLLDPGSAPKVIKTWDDRLEESGVESGVDDEVGVVGRRASSYSVSVPFDWDVCRLALHPRIVFRPDILRVLKLQALSSLGLLSASLHATPSDSFR
jgi:hypothetical protein